MEYTLELKEFGNGNKVISELNKEITIDVNMIGEGIVFSTNVNGNGIIYRMKVKGDKHSKSKVRVLKQVDNEKINNAINTAQKVCKNWRMEQMLSETFDFINGGSVCRSKLGIFIKAVMTDIIKEESLVLEEAGLEPKDIGKYVSEIARRYFFDYENENL